MISSSTDLLFKIRKNKIKVSDEEEEQVIQLLGKMYITFRSKTNNNLINILNLALLSKKQKCSSMMGLKRWRSRSTPTDILLVLSFSSLC